MKKILIILFAILINTNLQSAGDGGGSSNESMYDEGVKLVKRAGKLEKKDNIKKINLIIPYGIAAISYFQN